MPAVKSRALVISEKPYKERDKIVTLFTEEEGKVSAVVKGARNPRSQLSAATRLFSWAEFVYWPGKGLATVQEASLIDPFYSIGENLETMMLASYPLELISTFYDQNQEDPVILKILVYYLYYLAHEKESDPELLTAAFQLKLFQAQGLTPELSLEGLKDGPLYFSMEEGRITDKRAGEGFFYRMSEDEVRLMQKLLATPIHRLKNAAVPKEMSVKVMRILNHFLRDQAGKSFKTYEMWDENRSIMQLVK